MLVLSESLSQLVFEIEPISEYAIGPRKEVNVARLD